jgi:hypothetical protein
MFVKEFLLKRESNLAFTLVVSAVEEDKNSGNEK